MIGLMTGPVYWAIFLTEPGVSKCSRQLNEGNCMDEKTIINNFTYHTPKGTQTERYSDLRAGGKSLALIINELCPESREKSLAITKLEEAIMWANASIARNE
jgi:hypothetical protein